MGDRTHNRRVRLWHCDTMESMHSKNTWKLIIKIHNNDTNCNTLQSKIPLRRQMKSKNRIHMQITEPKRLH